MFSWIEPVVPQAPEPRIEWRPGLKLIFKSSSFPQLQFSLQGELLYNDISLYEMEVKGGYANERVQSTYSSRY